MYEGAILQAIARSYSLAKAAKPPPEGSKGGYSIKHELPIFFFTFFVTSQQILTCCLLVFENVFYSCGLLFSPLIVTN